MDYMTLKEASEKWGVTTRWINYSLLYLPFFRCSLLAVGY